VPALLETAVPRWSARERHRIRVHAPVPRVYDAVLTVTAGEIFLFRALTFLRRLGRRGPEGILNPPKDAPILAVALRTGFHRIAEEAPDEIVIGLYVIPPDRALAAINFRLQETPDGVELTTETRVATKDAQARRRFFWYWLLIRGGSGFIRRMWLRAIKRRAEGVGTIEGEVAR